MYKKPDINSHYAGIFTPQSDISGEWSRFFCALYNILHKT